MRNILKFIISLILILGVSIPGCTRNKKEVLDNKKIIIRYETFEHLPGQQVLIKKIIQDFEQEHTGIKVKLEFSPDPNKVLIETAGGSAPDVFYGGDWNATVFVSKGAVENLTPFIERENIDLKDYFSPCIEIFSYNKKLYCFPLHFSSYALAFNKNLFKQASISFPDEDWTWDDFLKAAKILTRDTNGDGRIDQFGTLKPPPELLIYSKGGRVFNEERNRCLLDSPEVIEAISFVKDLETKYKVTPSTGQLKEQGTILLFLMGKIGMFIVPTFMITEFQKIKDFEWDIAPIPKCEIRVSSLSVGGLYISSQSKHKSQAWEFVKYYCGKKGQSLLAQQRNAVPSHKQVAWEVFSVPPPSNISIFIKAIDYAIPSDSMMAIFNEFASQIYQPLLDRIFLGEISVEDGLKEIVKQTNNLIINSNKKGGK